MDTYRKVPDGVIKNGITHISKSSPTWFEYLEWLDQGNTPEPAFTLTQIRQDQIGVIKKAFLDTPGRGLTTSLGLKVDCDRMDLENFQVLLESCNRKGLAGATIRLHDNTFAEVTVEDLQTIINEIQEYGLSLYQRKWAKESAIEQAATEAQIKAITWDSVE